MPLRACWLWCSSLLLAACANGVPSLTRPASASAATASAGMEIAQGCDRLQARHPDATFVLYLPASGRRLVCNSARAEREFLPASTFKIANALIGLETGAVRDEHETFAWDGRRRVVAAWNQDTDLAGGMRNSTVWYYQALARRIGFERMRTGVARLGYGNADIGGAQNIDHFWLDGALRITAFEQIDFLDRLRRRALPLGERSQAITVRILERDRGDGWVLRTKSGAALPIDATGDVQQAGDVGSEPVGWIDGWVERDAAEGGDAVFALNLRLRGNASADMALREPLARELLIANGVLPGPVVSPEQGD